MDVPHDDLPDVDFVLGRSDQSADEDLPQPPARDWPFLARYRRPLVALAGVAVVLGAVVAVTRGSDDATAPAAQSPAPSASSTPSTPSTSTFDPTTGGRVDAPVVFHLIGCAKDSTSCITRVPADPDLGAIVRRGFPRAHLTTGSVTTRGPQGALVSRTIHASDDTQFIAIEITTRSRQVDNPPPAGLTGVEVDKGRFTIFATVVRRTPSGLYPYPALNRVASDPRLVH